MLSMARPGRPKAICQLRQSLIPQCTIPDGCKSRSLFASDQTAAQNSCHAARLLGAHRKRHDHGLRKIQMSINKGTDHMPCSATLFPVHGFDRKGILFHTRLKIMLLRCFVKRRKPVSGIIARGANIWPLKSGTRSFIVTLDAGQQSYSI